MERKPVKSTNIVSVGHDPESNTMHIEFQGGAVYEYKGVPHDEYLSFVHDPSPGGHFQRHIRNRFSGKKV